MFSYSQCHDAAYVCVQTVQTTLYAYIDLINKIIAIHFTVIRKCHSTIYLGLTTPFPYG